MKKAAVESELGAEVPQPDEAAVSEQTEGAFDAEDENVEDGS